MNNAKGAGLFLIGLIALLHAGNFAPQDPDLGLHLAVGKTIADEGHQPLQDRFTYTTQDADFVNFEWGFDWASYELYTLGGGTALWCTKMLLLVLMASLLFAIVILYARGDPQKSLNSRIFLLALLLLSIPVFRYRLVVRPHMMGYFMLLLHLLVARQFVETCSRNHRRILGGVLVGTMPLWAAMHGSWPLAFAISGLHFLYTKETRKAFAFVLFLELLVLLPNPHGLALLWVPFEHLTAAGGGPIPEEWMSPDQVLPNAHALIFYGCFVLFGLAFFWGQDKRFTPEIILGLLLFLMANRMARFVTPALLVLLPLTAVGMAHWVDRCGKKRRLAITISALCVGMLSYVSFFEHPGQEFPSGRSWNTDTMPRAAASTIKTHKLPGRIFNDFDIGNDLCWTLGPEHAHAIDGRVNLFGSEGLQNYVEILNDPRAFQEHVRRFDVQMVLLQWSIPRNQILVSWLVKSKDFGLVHMDARYAVWAQSRALSQARTRGLVFQFLRLPVPPFDLTTMIRSPESPTKLLSELARVQGVQGEPLASLMAVNAYSQLAKHPEAKTQQRGYLDKVIEAADRVVERGTIGQLDTLYARLRRGQALLQIQKFDAARADFEEVLKYMDHPEAKTGIKTLDSLR
jgi:hypothetical protein